MRPGTMLLAGAAALSLTVSGRVQSPNAAGQVRVRTISVTGARPVADAMDVIEKRYAVPIDYVDPRYAAPQDVDGTSYRPGHVTIGPRTRSITVQYEEAPGCPKNIPYITCNNLTMGRAPVTAWPVGGVTALIQRVLDQFAAEGGQVFLAQKMETTYGGQMRPGPRWLVYAEEVRDASGKFAYQPDFLGAQILFPRPQKSPPPPRVPPPVVLHSKAYWMARAQQQMQEAANIHRSIWRQLEQIWGDEFRAGFPVNPSRQLPDEANDHYVTAWSALAELAGPWRAWRLFYAPDTGLYYLNLVNLPYRPPPRPSDPPPPRFAAPSPRSLYPVDWLRIANIPTGIGYLQDGLAKAGYLHTPPTTRWDANASLAIHRFQLANGLLPTGKIDISTIEKLEPYLHKFTPPPMPPPNPLGPALAYWLESTRRGQRDIQRALAEEGFYSGPLTGNIVDPETRKALKNFQETNGLKPTGLFDDPTSRKLAPLLLKMKD